MLPNTYDRDDSIGVRRDTLCDALSDAKHAEEVLKEINVQLDDIADDREGIWTDDERSELRMMQETVQTLIEASQKTQGDIAHELKKVDIEASED